METSVLPVEAGSLEAYSAIPISFEVRSKLGVVLVDEGLGGILLYEEAVSRPYVKDYDRREGPVGWTRRWDTGNWVQFLARWGGVAVGGAIIAYRTPEINMLDGRDDVAALWDIRVRPEHRRAGVGSAVFAEVVKWARGHDCRRLKIETQNVNVAACRFYVRQGCGLGEIDRYAYAGVPEVADEVMLVWHLDL